MALKSAISFGLVYIPIIMHIATTDHDIKSEDIINDFDSIHILHFTKLDEINATFYDKTYQAVPEPCGERAFELLRMAMMDEKMIALAKSILGTKEILLVLIPRVNCFLVQTLFFEIEIKGLLKTYAKTALNDAELAMAKAFIVSMSQPFEVEEYHDESQKHSLVTQNDRENIRKRQTEGIIAAKAKGVRFGRPIKKSPENFGEVVKQWEQGKISFKEALEQAGLKEATFYRRLREYRVQRKK